MTYVESPEPHREIPLVGGDVTEGVVRVGDTVRRPVGPNAPLVHALLRHLEEGAPRFLGIDAATTPGVPGGRGQAGRRTTNIRHPAVLAAHAGNGPASE
ncbi:hypothetical protein [Streptosporangium sandarakinum]|uniref:hypothetical protein n=1 Tax=Streptosporangium sandarakinum TaxID=1260955 RepID=UPI0037195868